ncbi:MAG: septum formation initiator family protein [Syntrophaceae bacterium]|nr:septum formation initiator family protein [Syntrophaceae bacterium]
MKIGRFLLVFFLLMVLLIIFGDKGLMDCHMLNGKLTSLEEFNKGMVSENGLLKKEILLLREDLQYIEMMARKELGMVKKGDIVYRFTD